MHDEQTIDEAISNIRAYRKKGVMETVFAIKGSIAKWDLIAHGIGTNRRGFNCPLCIKFRSCDKCPVGKDTTKSNCMGTPYEYINLPDNIYLPRWIQYFKELIKKEEIIDLCCDLIEDEIEYLISLLPESEQNKYN